MKNTLKTAPIPMQLSQPAALLSGVIRVIIGGILIYAGFSKAVAPAAEFAAAIAAYKALPAVLVSPIAQIWPWLELLTGTYILAGYYTPIFSRVAAIMFGVFLAVVVSALVRGIDPGACGCFGLGLSFPIQKMAVFDSILFVLSVLLSGLSKFPLPLSIDAWASY